jgi:hypothetical protein
MKITQEHIVNLVKQNPNDAVLGSAVRELVLKSQNTNEIQIDPQQISLLDSINEVTNSGDGYKY